MATPMSAVKLIEILYKAGLPKQMAQVVICDDNSIKSNSFKSKINFLTFIGSAKVGWYLNSKVASGTRVALEHGGVAPVIVEADANIDELIPSIGKGGFYHAGQVCVSVQRIYVHSSICEEVSSKLSDYASSLVVGNQLDPKTEVGPIINHNETNRIEQWVNEAKEQGATILTGGNKISASCYEPTVAFRVDWMPFGGAKASGLGLGGIHHSMQEMTNEKMMVIKSPSL